ncbi:MAG: nucleotide-binding protein [Dehalococcoidia bacterium]|nr:nucleotide-binding protein [Chloroflexota bacterium]MCK4242460.1 nucleotide-binding protein [Dehalococcoidia bacterium]
MESNEVTKEASSAMSKRRPPRSFPKHTLEESVRVAQAIQDNNAGKPFNRLLLAQAIGRSPASSEFKYLLSSSYKYGLTTGTEKAELIGLTPVGVSITKPRSSPEKQDALRKAALNPDLFRQIYERYNNARLPEKAFFGNILEQDFHVAGKLAGECIDILFSNGRFVGIIQDISGSPHVLLQEGAAEVETVEAPAIERGPAEEEAAKVLAVEEVRIFVSHSRKKRILDQIKTMLEFGKYAYEVAVETETTAIPVPQKILEAMRRCNAAVINVSADEEERLEDGRYGINQNVLIEIGSAFVLYDQKVVLVVDNRIELPSNLQGLYRCEYEGDELSWEAGLKIQKAITDFGAGAAAGK